MGLEILGVIGDPLFQSNCYIVSCGESGEGVVIDPGSRVEAIVDAVEKAHVTVTAIVNTHGHVDHVSGAARIKSVFGVPLMMHEGDLPLLLNLTQQAAMFGMPDVQQPEIDRSLREGDVVAFGRRSLRVLHTPGHSPGGICLLDTGHLFTGDTLFAGSIGRTDLAGGDFETLINSIRGKILTLPPETAIHPGHGPDSTVGAEALTNPFLQ